MLTVNGSDDGFDGFRIGELKIKYLRKKSLDSRDIVIASYPPLKVQTKVFLTSYFNKFFS